jgi:acetolactate synthase I/II/III large subunit
MANGYARASGKTAVLATVAGPGLTYAVSGVAEALLDSVPLVHVVDAGAGTRPDGSPGLQAIRQTDVLAPLVKSVLEVRTAGEVVAATRAALATARAGEPGPVLLQIDASALAGSALSTDPPPDPASASEVATDDVRLVAERLLDARLPLLLVGMGAADAASGVTALAERLGAPVVSTTSGRGVVSEEHRLSLVSDAPGASVEPLNEVLGRADLVLALGCKLSHNGSRGYALALLPERLVRVDTAPSSLDGAYPASLTVERDVREVVAALLATLEAGGSRSQWTASELESVRSRLAADSPIRLNPRLGPGSAADLFSALRRRLPERSIVATDSGLHQYLVRAHFPVLAPRTLLLPTDFQSMGFGIPAAIGASIATGEPAVAVTGDGGLDIVGFEILTAVRERVRLTVLVLVDGYLGLIRVSQLARTGREAGVDISVPRLEPLARSLDADYALLDGSRGTEDVLGDALASDGVTIVEVPTGEPPDLRRLTRRGRARSAVRALRSTMSPDS